MEHARQARRRARRRRWRRGYGHRAVTAEPEVEVLVSREAPDKFAPEAIGIPAIIVRKGEDVGVGESWQHIAEDAVARGGEGQAAARRAEIEFEPVAKRADVQGRTGGGVLQEQVQMAPVPTR